jgi:CRP/FNR family transcriptional regulator
MSRGNNSAGFDFLKVCRIFDVLSEKEKDLLKSSVLTIKYKNGETIFKQGTPFSHLAVLTKGFGKIFIEGYDHDLILSLVKSGDLISDPGIWVDGKHHFSLSSLSATEINLIDIHAFGHLLQNNSEFSQKMRIERSLTEVSMFDKMLSLTQKHMSGRLAGTISSLSKSIFFADKFDMLISRQELADLTAMSKESVCRILKEFKDSKIIDFDGNNVEILNRGLLEKISEKG